MQRITQSAVIVVIAVGAFLHRSASAQVAQPLNVKTGLWEFTVTTKATSQPTPELMASYPPAVRSQMLAAMKAQAAAAKETVQERRQCIAPQNLEEGTLAPGAQSCAGQELTSSAQRLELHSHCGQEQVSRYERIDAEHLKGSVQTIQKSAVVITVDQRLAGRWIRDTCALTTEDLQARKQDADAKGIATGANRDVLSFLPYIPPRGDGGSDEGHLGHAFVYFWNGPNRKIPTVSYVGGFPGGPTGSSATYFHGTDGHFLYVTLNWGGAICGSEAYRYKIDRAGAPARITAIPNGLLGGKDELSGPPCTNEAEAPATTKPAASTPKDLSFLLPPQAMVAVQDGYYVTAPTPTDRWPPNNARLLHLYVKGDEISVMEVLGRGSAASSERLWCHGPYTSNPFRGEMTFHVPGKEFTRPVEVAIRPNGLYVGGASFHRLPEAVATQAPR